MAKPVKEVLSIYEQLEALPENLVGEIINGVLHAHPRPAGPHALAGSRLGADIEGPYSRGKGGPGGWWIIDEPEVHFARDTEVAVPDIAGWRKERMPRVPQDHRFEIVPDWICEILSPSSAKLDRTEKMPLYAKYGVAYVWLVDPLSKMLETFELIDERWSMMGVFKDEDRVQIKPFDEIKLELSDLWVPNEK